MNCTNKIPDTLTVTDSALFPGGLTATSLPGDGLWEASATMTMNDLCPDCADQFPVCADQCDQEFTVRYFMSCGGIDQPAFIGPTEGEYCEGAGCPFGDPNSEPSFIQAIPGSGGFDTQVANQCDPFSVIWSISAIGNDSLYFFMCPAPSLPITITWSI